MDCEGVASCERLRKRIEVRKDEEKIIGKN